MVPASHWAYASWGPWALQNRRRFSRRYAKLPNFWCVCRSDCELRFICIYMQLRCSDEVEGGSDWQSSPSTTQRQPVTSISPAQRKALAAFAAFIIISFITAIAVGASNGVVKPAPSNTPGEVLSRKRCKQPEDPSSFSFVLLPALL